MGGSKSLRSGFRFVKKHLLGVYTSGFGIIINNTLMNNLEDYKEISMDQAIHMNVEELSTITNNNGEVWVYLKEIGGDGMYKMYVSPELEQEELEQQEDADAHRELEVHGDMYEEMMADIELSRDDYDVSQCPYSGIWE